MKLTETKLSSPKAIYKNWRNPKTSRLSEVIIYHQLQKITVCTTDKNDFYYQNKITAYLNKLNLEVKKKTKKDMSNYLIQILHIS